MAPGEICFFLALVLSAFSAQALNLKPPTVMSSSYVEWGQVYNHYKQSAANNLFLGRDPPPAQAGVSLANVDKHIIGGAEASRGQFPWMVKIFLDETFDCGGSLICSQWVLTAGHCVHKVKSFVLYIGAHNVEKDMEDGRLILSSTIRKIHPKYENEILANDIAVIKLPKRVVMDQFVNFIRLPKKSDMELDFVGVKTTVSGWGLTKDNGSVSNVLRYLKDKIVITNDECSKNYGNIDKSIMCIEGKNNQSICGGDSGGPLIYKESDQKWTQIGIVSFGHKESCLGFPQGFTRVTHYLGWISSKTGLKIAN